MAICSPERIEELEAFEKGLESILLSGAGEVQHGDKRVRYNTPDEIREALRDVRAELRRCDGGKPTRIVKLYADRGV